MGIHNLFKSAFEFAAGQRSSSQAASTYVTPQLSRQPTPQNTGSADGCVGLKGLSKVPASSLDGLTLQLVVVQGRNLSSDKERRDTCNCFVVLELEDHRNETQSFLGSTNPIWNAEFAFSLDLALPETCLKMTCWDRDRFAKIYLGEACIPLSTLLQEELSESGIWYPLVSTEKVCQSTASGEILLRVNLMNHTQTNYSELRQKWLELTADTISLEYSAGESDLEGEGDLQNGERKIRRRRIRRLRKRRRPFEFGNKESEVVGIVYFEVVSCTDLPPERNVTRTSFDMDPFVIVSFGKKTLRTKHVRHKLNPVFNEKMIFQVLKHEQNFSIMLQIIDKDKFSSNDFVAEAKMDVQELIKIAPVPDPDTELYSLPEPDEVRHRLHKSRSRLGFQRKDPTPTLSRTSSSVSIASPPMKLQKHLSQLAIPSTDASDSESENVLPTVNTMESQMKQFELPLTLYKKDQWEEKHNPLITLRGRFIPYAALRQQFWRCMLRQYDADESGNISRIELTTMLDSLGSTLTDSTIDGFFERFKATIDPSWRESAVLTMDQAVKCLEDEILKRNQSQQSSSVLDAGSSKENSHYSRDDISMDDSSESDTAPTTSNSDTCSLGKDDLADLNSKEEHVIMIKECPICHQPRMNKRSEVDIVTHLATCASQDWRRVDRFVMGGFVTSSQAQRKWYSKVISKVGYGGYRLGANSANILVQDRVTGQVQEERMSAYVRLGIRLLYKGLKSGEMERRRMRKLLASLSIKQGKKYDSPASVRDIKSFIAFHRLDMDEVKLPIEAFKSFNEFFYRQLKPDARPCTARNNEYIAVSPADCRSVVFNKIEKATEIWIKGRDFSIPRLLGEAYPEDVERFENGALGIFRLAPQDYHRFHVPVDGVLGEPKTISGQYYTVNPMAIRSSLDVYGENVRVLCPIDSNEFGRVMVVCIGAMMVGSTIITAKAGDRVARTDEMGYFKFGGSTLVLLFESGKLVFDEDLIDNSKEKLETLLRVGASIGHHPQEPSQAPTEEDRQNVTIEMRRRASIAIGGSITPPKDLQMD